VLGLIGHIVVIHIMCANTVVPPSGIRSVVKVLVQRKTLFIMVVVGVEEYLFQFIQTGLLRCLSYFALMVALSVKNLCV
jgi:hypothetical protein